MNVIRTDGAYKFVLSRANKTYIYRDARNKSNADMPGVKAATQAYANQQQLVVYLQTRTETITVEPKPRPAPLTEEQSEANYELRLEDMLEGPRVAYNFSEYGDDLERLYE